MKKIFLNALWRAVLWSGWMWVIWHHAHWSIALFATTAVIRFEAEDILKDLEKLREREAEDLFSKYGCR